MLLSLLKMQQLSRTRSGGARKSHIKSATLVPTKKSSLHMILSVFPSLILKSIKPISVMLTLATAAWWAVNTAAQTEIELQSSNSDLESEYQKELDKWMLQAYEGDRDAQFRVGVLFTNDQFQSPDYEQAVYWYKQAARQGHTLAQYNLGHQYLTGVGVKRNETTAMSWWLKAAEQEHALAQFNVGRAYYLGIGLKEDHDQSRLWFERAARNSEPKSIDILEQLGWAKPGQYAVKQDDETSEPTQASLPTKELEIPAKEIASTPPDQTTTQSTAAVLPRDEPSARPIAIYTDPDIRSVLIAIVDDREELELVSQDDVWTIVTSEQGFPVWIHSRFIVVADDIGTITATNVNARSVPIITNGTIVGQVDKGETMAVLDSRDNWFRVVSPKSFQAWVKTSEFDAAPTVSEPEQVTLQAEVQTPVASSEPAYSKTEFANDNEWLFKQPAENYTLQLASFDDPAKIKEFVSREKFVDNPELHRFTASSNSIEWTYFLYGSYQDSTEANKI